jgi:hypothetical protein
MVKVKNPDLSRFSIVRPGVIVETVHQRHVSYIVFEFGRQNISSSNAMQSIRRKLKKARNRPAAFFFFSANQSEMPGVSLDRKREIDAPHYSIDPRSASRVRGLIPDVNSSSVLLVCSICL